MCSLFERIPASVAAVLLFPLLFCACINDDGPVGPGTGDTPVASPSSRLRFGVTASTASRVTNSGVSGVFDNGESVGCVVAYLNDDGTYEYQANTRWVYNKDNSVLVLSDVWSADGTTKQTEAAAQRVICRDMEKDMKDGTDTGSGYLKLLDAGRKYCFFFYYPYVDEDDIMQAKWWITNTKDPYRVQIPVSTVYASDFANWNLRDHCTKTMLTGTVSKSFTYFAPDWSNPDNSKPCKYAWTAYPSFVGLGQSNKLQSNNSDFMYASCVVDPATGKDITLENVDTHHTIDLTFRKKMAAVELVTDLNLTDPVFQSHDGSTIVAGQRIDLSNGKVSNYKYLDKNMEWAASADEKIQQLSCATADAFRPYKISELAGEKTWRIILPPQSGFKCNLKFKLDGVDKTLDLSKKIGSLEENRLYVVRLLGNVDEQWTVIIRDWEDGDNMLIQEN